MNTILRKALVNLAATVLPSRLNNTLREAVRQRRLQQGVKQREERMAFWSRYTEEQGPQSIEVHPGVQMNLYWDSELAKLIYLGEYEGSERLFLNFFLRPGDVFIDVGANIGLYSLTAAALVGQQGKVYAFEPCLKTYNRLLDNVKLNNFSNVLSHQCALSNHAGTLQMTASLDGFDAWNSLAKPFLGQEFEAEEVTASTWDHVSSDLALNGKVAMMKIDIEGWEPFFFEGARESLQRADAPVLQVEFCDQAMETNRHRGRDLYQQIEKLGYRLYSFDSLKRILVQEPIQDVYPYSNLYAVKNPEFVVDRLQSGPRACAIR